MKVEIIVSKKDAAGMNIAEFLKNENLNGASLHFMEEESVFCEDIDNEIDADLFIFATKHQSASGVPSLCVHTPGNWGKADYGGKDKELGIAPASYLKAAFLKLVELSKERELNYEVIQECTHHGPFISKPCMFIEIGSTEKEWVDKEAGRVIADVILFILQNPPKQCKAVFGIGGIHHTPNFRKIIENTEMALGHVCPKYNLQNLDENMIRQAMERMMEKDIIVMFD